VKLVHDVGIEGKNVLKPGDLLFGGAGKDGATL
jgi:hypothetical protein